MPAPSIVGWGYIPTGQLPISERLIFTLTFRYCPVGIYAHPTFLYANTGKPVERMDFPGSVSACSFRSFFRDKCGLKFFVHRKDLFFQVLRVSGGERKNAPNLDDWEHFHAFLGRITSSEPLQQQQPRKRSYRPWGCCRRQKPAGSKLPWRDSALKS